ncbi:MAG: GGDEF domain-containing protein, partial [Thiovulaceae bacterium]|nr:GGDEF domain-containing protein [Sulfurimonadaceae bacterium]
PLVFDESEELLQFRFTTLMIMIMLITAYSFIYAVLNLTGLDDLGVKQSIVNFFQTLVGIGLFFYLRKSKDNYSKALYVLFVMLFIAFSLTLVFVPNDEFRVIWFFVLVIGSYIVGDIFLGVITSITGLIVIGVLNTLFELNISDVAMFSIVGSYIVVSFFMFAYTKRMDRFQEELIEKKNMMEKLATFDALTGIMNRRLFLEMAEKYLSEAERLKKHFYFLMIDIDHFKKINDNYGHHVGDEVLRRFSLCVGSEMRKSDLFGRIGGEEFGVVILSDEEEDAVRTAERIREIVERNSCSIDKNIMKITTSVGLVQERDNETLVEIMKRADAVLYRAKDEGRNRVVADLSS